MEPQTQILILFGVRVKVITILKFGTADVTVPMICPICQNIKSLTRYVTKGEKIRFLTEENCPGERKSNERNPCSNGKLLGNARDRHARCNGTSRITCRICRGAGLVRPYDIMIGKPLSGEHRNKVLAYAICRRQTVGPLRLPIRYPEPSDNCLVNSAWTVGVPNYKVEKN